LRDFIFKYRGWLFIPTAIAMLYLAKPTMPSLVFGLAVSFLLGEGIRIWAVGFTGVTTRDDKVVAPSLVTAGPYAHLRNPLYLGNLISWIGFCIASAGAVPPWAAAVIFGATILSYGVIYGAIIPLEEAYLEKTFGEPFKEYVKSVPRLLPRPAPYQNAQGRYDPGVILRAELHTILMLLALAAVLVLKFTGTLTFHPY
jgi:protein-S-isoprenylcysteine O-methyltransferase Ste14